MAYAVRRNFKSGVRFTGFFAEPDGSMRSAGNFNSNREALRAARRQEQRVLSGTWHDARLGAIWFKEYVERDWLPSKHIEASTMAAYVSNLNKHFFPFFGKRPIAKITPSVVQDWVTEAAAGGLKPRSIRKYHTMLHSIFKRAVRDQLIVVNPCEHTELPKVIVKKTRTLTPEEFDVLIDAIPERHRMMVETAIETGMRWGELIALKPRHIDFLRRQLTVEETIVEVSKKHSPTGERYVHKPYPKDNEPRTFGVRQDWLTTAAGTPLSRNTFRTRVWLPAVEASGIGFAVRMHDLRHAHASWLLAGGSDLKSVMERMGHAQIQTTQKYLHALPNADQKNLDALNRVTRRGDLNRTGEPLTARHRQRAPGIVQHRPDSPYF
jgi:site-specific recombinase XerD